jgi:hypothetical protein
MKQNKFINTKVAALACIGAGGMMFLEHILMYGYFDVSPVCHGFYGLVLIIIGWIIGMYNTKNKEEK